MQINEHDLKYFTAAALSGLCANPAYSTPQVKQHMIKMGLTTEKLAVKCALQVIKEIELLKHAMAENGHVEGNENGDVHTGTGTEVDRGDDRVSEITSKS